MGSDFTDFFSERDFFSPFDWNVLAFDKKKVSEPATHCFLGTSLPLPTPVLLLPHLFEYWVVEQLAPLEALYRLLIQDRHGPVQYKLIWIAAAGC